MIWRVSLLRNDGKEIPFNFRTTDSVGRPVLYVMNGKERLLVDSIRIKKDSVFIEMPFFDSHFALRFSGQRKLEGQWIKRYGHREVSLPCVALGGVQERFPASTPPAFNVSGRWAVQFSENGSPLEESVGEFQQSGSSVTGTFLTTTGDYRFLEGVVDGDSLKLSTFDGGHAYAFTAKITDNKTLAGGNFYAGATSQETWTATKDEKAALPDEYSITTLKDPAQANLNFRFKSTEGKWVSIKDSRFRHKVVIVQIMGSWCPNCMDETKFLSDYYKKNQHRGVEIIGLAYERTTSFEESKKSLQAFRNRFQVTYPFLISGVAVTDTLRTEKTLPQLNRLVGFPTTIFIDKMGRVRKISTGFNGPGTGDHYEIFEKEFNELVDGLLAE
ncbi:MAG TPA: TlpA disulfide reductase family protein [Puia sp.]|nr:TlpA disulfide reductase family protein [Puia sp.]